MSLTVNTLTYERDVAIPPRGYQYFGPSHSFNFEDRINLKRNAPKATATSPGKSRVQAKLTRSVTDGTVQLTEPSIFSFDAAVPVGADSTEVQACMTDLATWLLTTAADELLTDGKIQH